MAAAERGAKHGDTAPKTLSPVLFQGEKGERGEAVSASVSSSPIWWLTEGLHPPSRSDAIPQGMLIAGFVSVGTTRTSRATRPPWRAGNILTSG